MSTFITETNTNINNNLDPEFPYMVPSRQCEPIIQCAILNFHDKTIPNPLSSKLSLQVQDQDQDQVFGILTLKIRDEIPATKNLDINFMVDCSASMAEQVDKHTKMAHVVHTLKNMITIFHNLKSTNVKVRVDSFDNATYTNIDTEGKNVRESELQLLIDQVSQIVPQGSTNIELALLHVNKNSNKHLETERTDKTDKTDKIHLFLTDGCITSGSENIDYLKTLVSPHYINYFIGYGLDHDSTLLSALASTGQHNEYRFVDALEKAGLVYGEIIHDILYKALEDVTLEAENCEIYDYQTNTWTTRLSIGHLCSDQKKTYQIRAANPDRALIAISARSLYKTRAHQEVSKHIVFQTHASSVSSKCDLSDYFLRQKTQELLYNVKELLLNGQSEKEKEDLYSYYGVTPNQEKYTKQREEEDERIKKKTDLKEELKVFLNILLDYVTLHKKEKDLFLRTLCDDMYIAFKTINSSKGSMFVNSRQTSQGRQQTYSAKSNFETDSSQLPLNPPQLQRGITLCSYRSHINQQEPESEPNPLVLDCDDIKYSMRQDDDSAYASLGVVQMMREVSIGPKSGTKGLQDLSIELPSIPI
jgi:bifunctional DNase/RNase